MTSDHVENVGKDANDPAAFAGLDVTAFAAAYAHWLDHEGGRERLEEDAARSRREIAGTIRGLTSTPRGLDERF